MRVVIALCFVFAVASAGWWPCDKELNKEYPPSDEAEALAKMTKIVLARQKEQVAAGGDALRFFHAKAHAGVRATFTVSSTVPSQYRWGIFSTPGKTFDAFMRFSNGLGTISPDSGLDTRGAALKILGCEGLRLMEGETAAESKECDFITAAYNRFFFGTASDVAEGMDVLSADGISGAVKKGIFFLTHPSSAAAIIGMGLQGKAVKNPLTASYWSQTPYRLGPNQAVKHMIKPCTAGSDPEPDKSNPDYLRAAMEKQLNQDGRAGCFQFLVQPQLDACDEPIENSLKAWETPWTVVATINIPAHQDISSATARLQTQELSFNPWRNVVAHRPLGINRVRKDIYVTSSGNRHKLNQHDVYHPKAALAKNEL